ncbi:DEAD/DEAH box helicase [Rhodococcus sp. HNM0563]|uniref:DEAD/DEAH box helicase n=1 Tax=Rhodococcus sp. HNM0563 TaxID=2716339 RepID=UPI001F0CF45D|nr:DEAD/DEAH box helicase [Rhodococcus sp. HNM0563]
MTSATIEGLSLRAWQSEAFNAWVEADRRAVVEAVMGTGKTALGIAAAADAIARGLSVLVVVPGVELLNQWHREIGNSLPGVAVGRRGDGNSDTFRGHRIVVSTVQSATGFSAPRPVGPALLIADEVHRYGAPRYSRLLLDAFTERMGLTATLERNDDGVERLLLPYFETVIEGCTYERGRADGILAPVRVMLVEVPFDSVEAAEYQECDELARKLYGKLIHNLGCSDESFGEFMRDVQLLSDGPNAEKATWTARRYLHAISQRRTLLAESSSKLDALRDLGTVLRESGRALAFSETKKSARAAAEVLLEEGVLAAPFTSELSRLDRNRLLTAFRNGAVTTLVAPKVLDEGVDVPEADVGVILASSKTRRQMIQRMGRIIRPKLDGRAASFLVMYAKGSSEDPSTGAHGTFLEQLTGIASEVVTVGPEGAPELLRSWLAIERDNGGAADVGSSAVGVDSEEFEATIDVDEDIVEIAHRLVEDDTPEVAPTVESEDVDVRRILLSVGAYGDVDDLDTVLACLSVLDPQQVAVLILRFGLAGESPKRHNDIGVRLGMSAVQVGRVETAALECLGDAATVMVLAELMVQLDEL